MTADKILALTQGEACSLCSWTPNILLDIFEDDPHWADWLATTLERYTTSHIPTINPIIYAKVSKNPHQPFSDKTPHSILREEEQSPPGCDD